jgi:predicted DNA-binding protein
MYQGLDRVYGGVIMAVTLEDVMYRTTIMLPEELKSRVVRESDALGISMGEFIREAVSAAVEKKSAESAVDVLLDDEAVFEGDAPDDTASRHDHYLYGEAE